MDFNFKFSKFNLLNYWSESILRENLSWADIWDHISYVLATRTENMNGQSWYGLTKTLSADSTLLISMMTGLRCPTKTFFIFWYTAQDIINNSLAIILLHKPLSFRNNSPIYTSKTEKGIIVNLLCFFLTAHPTRTSWKGNNTSCRALDTGAVLN